MLRRRGGRGEKEEVAPSFALSLPRYDAARFVAKNSLRAAICNARVHWAGLFEEADVVWEWAGNLFDIRCTG